MTRFILLSIIKHPHDKNSSRPQQKMQKIQLTPPAPRKSQPPIHKKSKKTCTPQIKLVYLHQQNSPLPQKKREEPPRKAQVAEW